MLIRTFLVAAALALAGQAQAADFSVTSGFVSKHADDGYNERNNGIGFRMDSGDWSGWGIGTYKNSLARQTVYVAKEWQWHVAGPVSVGAIAGLATGYNYVVIPAVLPEIVFRVDVLELALIAQPLNLEDSPAFVALQVRLHF